MNDATRYSEFMKRVTAKARELHDKNETTPVQNAIDTAMWATDNPKEPENPETEVWANDHTN